MYFFNHDITPMLDAYAKMKYVQQIIMSFLLHSKYVIPLTKG